MLNNFTDYSVVLFRIKKTVLQFPSTYAAECTAKVCFTQQKVIPMPQEV